MEKAKNESEAKYQLVTEICNISNNATASFAHRRCHRNPLNALFVDWYLVLRVNDTAGVDIIRKHYLRLALLLHPDKNSHPKAEFAFKLVSEAYICLSDNGKRKAFDLERLKIVCRNDSYEAFKCCTKTETKSKEVLSSKKGKNQILQRMKDLKTRFRQEAVVIENCLRDYAPPKRSISSESKIEYPIFNPPNYGYPHMSATSYYKNTTQEKKISENSIQEYFEFLRKIILLVIVV